MTNQRPGGPGYPTPGCAAPDELERLRDERELLRLQLRQALEELDAHTLELRTLRERLDRQPGRRDAEVAAELKRLRKERDELSERLRWATDDLAKLHHSLSWKITWPMRRILGWFTGGSGR